MAHRVLGMALEALGTTVDIHGGGMDLQFPHHENEIAQSEAVTGQLLLVHGCMWASCSRQRKNVEILNNFFTIREVLEHFSPEVVRYFLLSSHYRSPLNYSDRALKNAQAALTRVIWLYEMWR